jgi:phenylacetate-coenzyme A ligase PaaK-like adenylate-forming protein
MDYVGGTLRYEAYSLDDFTFAVIVRKIIQIETFTIYAYTSFAKAFAQYLITNSVSIPAPQSVVVTSEVTSNKDIDLLASIFGCPIYCEYGLVEFGPVFIKESTNANYIINSSSFLAEQDPNNQLVITDLADLDYPFLRYVTGDEVLSPSEIQAPFLTELIDIRGRHCDIVKITTTAGVVSAHSEIVSHALKIFDSVLDFQCHTCQGMLDRISIVISQSQNQAVSNSQLSRMILDQLSKYLGSDPLNIEIHFTTKLVRGSSGKKINIIREAA